MTEKNARKDQINEIPGFVDYYVSSSGTVYSHKNGNYRVLYQRIHPHGNRTVKINKKHHQVHRLVLMAWERLPEPDEMAVHLDGNPSNNNLSNLAWATADRLGSLIKEQKKQIRAMLFKPRRLKEKPRLDFQTRLMHQEIKALSTIYSVEELAQRYARSLSQVYTIIRQTIPQPIALIRAEYVYDQSAKRYAYGTVQPDEAHDFTLKDYRLIPGMHSHYISASGQVVKKNKTGYRLLKILSATDTYALVTINNKKYRVSRLVLSAFVREPLPGEVARHLDGNPANNHLSNLEWGTQTDNMKDARIHQTLATSLTEEQVCYIRTQITHRTISQIAHELNINRGTVRAIALGHTWKHITDPPAVSESEIFRKRSQGS